MEDTCGAVGLCKSNLEMKGCKMHSAQLGFANEPKGCRMHVVQRMQDAEGCRMHAMRSGFANQTQICLGWFFFHSGDT